MSPAATGYASRPAVSPRPVTLDELPPLLTIGFPGPDRVAESLARFPGPLTRLGSAPRPSVILAGPYGASVESEAWREDGRAFRLEVAPGTVRLRSYDPVRRERRAENAPMDHGASVPGNKAERVQEAANAEQAARWASEGVEGPGGDGARVNIEWHLYGKHGLPAPVELPPGHREGTCECHADRKKPPVPRSTVSEWSRKSRANFQYTIASLDWTPFFAQAGVPCMPTLTYPGEWLSVAPSGSAVKGHVRTLWKRWHRRWGSRPMGMWKLEFQARGAPHVHAFVMRPHLDPRTGHVLSSGAFARWLSATWAQIVDHADPVQRARHTAAGTRVDYAKGADCRDPRRLAVYFGKHSSKGSGDKEYQHVVPREWRSEWVNTSTGEITANPGFEGGPGRFWGYVGLSKSVGAVDLAGERDYVLVRRTARRWANARARYLGRRQIRSLGAGGGLAGGWVMVNDGPAFARGLAAALALSRAPDPDYANPGLQDPKSRRAVVFPPPRAGFVRKGDVGVATVGLP